MDGGRAAHLLPQPGPPPVMSCVAMGKSRMATDGHAGAIRTRNRRDHGVNGMWRWWWWWWKRHSSLVTRHSTSGGLGGRSQRNGPPSPSDLHLRHRRRRPALRISISDVPAGAFKSPGIGSCSMCALGVAGDTAFSHR